IEECWISRELLKQDFTSKIIFNGNNKIKIINDNIRLGNNYINFVFEGTSDREKVMLKLGQKYKLSLLIKKINQSHILLFVFLFIYILIFRNYKRVFFINIFLGLIFLVLFYNNCFLVVDVVYGT